MPIELKIFSTILILVVAAIAWLAVCNDAAYNQRKRILDVIHAHNIRLINKSVWDPIARSLWKDFELVAYGDHLYALFFFRDPMLLYPRRLQVLVESYTK